VQYWLVKSDPDTYSWDDLKKEGTTSWDGIRNYAARLHLKAMKKGDKVLVYHSGGESVIKGLATVTKELYPDPTSKEQEWFSVELKAGNEFKNSVSLAQIKKTPSLKNMTLLKISRLSVMPVTEKEFETIVSLSV
jgi:predicted RNA-binding protein with PUA-like domain